MRTLPAASRDAARPAAFVRWIALALASAMVVFGLPMGAVDVANADPIQPSTTKLTVGRSAIQGNGYASSSSFSADRRYHAFSSTSSNIVTGDTNGVEDMFVYEVATGITTRLSLATDGTVSNGASQLPDISASGRYVSFSSAGSNLVGSDTNGFADLFVRDRDTDEDGIFDEAGAVATTRVSVGPSGAQANQASIGSAISGNGRWVAFYSWASNLVTGDTGGFLDAFLHDRQSATTTRVSLTNGGAEANGHSGWGWEAPAVSDDGNLVVFDSQASNLVAGDSNALFDIFMRDVSAGATTRISVSTAGAQGDNASIGPSLSPDGRFVVYSSIATNLVSGDANASYDIFVRDRNASTTERVSLTNGGLEGNGNSFYPAISNDGQAVSFVSSASNLVSGDVNGVDDVFVRDRTAGTTTRVSVSTSGAEGNGISGYTAWMSNPISTDGRYVGFVSLATNLVAGDTNGQLDLFVRDRTLSQTTRTSVGSQVEPANNATTNASMTPDGRYVAFYSLASNLVPGDSNAQYDVFVSDRLAGSTVRVSRASNGAEGNNLSWLPEISDTGRYVTFSSIASNLISGDTNAQYDVFLHDRDTDADGTFDEPGNVSTIRVSVNSAGAQATGASYAATVTPNGRFVAFNSAASDLVTGDTGFTDVFVRDVQAGTTSRVSTPAGGGQGNGESALSWIPPAISDDGSLVVFDSLASNLISGDTNAQWDVFTKTIATGDVGRISVTNSGGQATGGSSFGSVVSGDGRYVAFYSTATNLAAGDINAVYDLFLRDRTAGTTKRISNGPGGTLPNGPSMEPSISDDGRFVSFVSGATNLVPFDSNARDDVFVYDRTLGRTTRASEGPGVEADGSSGASVYSRAPVSNSGRYVAFASLATNLVSGDTNGYADGFVRDLGTIPPLGTGDPSCAAPPGGVPTTVPMRRVSVSSSGATGNNISRNSYVTADGRYTAFESEATNLVAGDTQGHQDIFVHDSLTGKTTRVSVSTSGVAGNNDSNEPVISADGRYVSFDSLATNLVTGDSNGAQDIFLHDRITGQTVRISLSDAEAQANAQSDMIDISADGRYIAFGSSATNLVTGDTNALDDLFVRDWVAGTTERVSLGDTENQQNAVSANPELSAAGQYVAFHSDASNLTPLDLNGKQDVFVRDRYAGSTTRASIPDGGGVATGGDSRAPDISPDGRYVAFHSWATNLVDGFDDSHSDIYVRDRVLNETSVISVTTGGGEPNGDSANADISADGRYVSFKSDATNLVSGDTNGDIDVFVRDRVSGITARVSITSEGAQSSGGTSYFPTMSSDGRYVSFASEATNLVSASNLGYRQAYVYDRGASAGWSLSPTLPSIQPLLPAAMSDESGLEQFGAYRSMDLGTGSAYVQLRTGNLVAQYTDTQVPGMGLNAVIRHTYNSSRRGIDVGLGQGWNLSVSDLDGLLDGAVGSVVDIDPTVAIRTGSIGGVVDGLFTATGFVLEFTDGDGTTHRFVKSGVLGCTRWQSPPGVSLRVHEEFDPITKLPTAYELVRPDGVVYRAEPLRIAGLLPTTTWRVVSIRDRNGNRLDFTYGGYALAAVDMRIESITHNRFPDAPLVRFEYTFLGDLDRMIALPGVTANDPATGTSRSYERIVDFNVDTLTRRLTSVTENSHLASGDADRVTTNFTYDTLTGALTGAEDGRENTTTFGHEIKNGALAVTSITDRRGEVWSYAYDTRASDAAEQVTRVTPPGRVDRDSTARSGVATIYRMSGRGAVDGSNDPRIAGGNLIELTDAGDNNGAVTSEYEWTQNWLTEVTDGAGALTQYQYNDLGLLTKVIQPPPNPDDSSRADLTSAPKTAVESTFTYGYPSQYAYASCTPPSSSGPVSTEGYCDSVAQLERVRMASNFTAADQRLSDFQYDGAGNLLKVIQRADPTTGQSRTDPPSSSDRADTFAYYSRGALKTVDGPRTDVSDVTTFGDTGDETFGAYDRTGMPTMVTDARSEAKVFTYSPYGLVNDVLDRDGGHTITYLDNRNQVWWAKDPSGHRMGACYDANGNATRQVSGRGMAGFGSAAEHCAGGASNAYASVTTYNENDLPTERSTPGASDSSRALWVWEYSDDSSLRKQMNPVDGESFADYYNDGSAKSAFAPAGTGEEARTDYEYDLVGRVSKTTLPKVNSSDRPVRRLFYTPQGGITEEKSTSAVSGQDRITRYAYNVHGDGTAVTGPRSVQVSSSTVSQVTKHVYDAFGQVTQLRRLVDDRDSSGVPTGTREIVSTFSYDLAGNRVGVVQPTGSTGSVEADYVYDVLNRLVAQTRDGQNPQHRVTYAYSDEGLQTVRTDWSKSGSGAVDCRTDTGCAALRTATTTYNADDTVARLVFRNESTSETLVACYSDYDADDLVGSTRHATGTSDCSGGTLLRTLSGLTYNKAGWLTAASQTVRAPGGQEVTRSQSFTYLDDGTRASASHGGNAIDYTHSPAGWNETVEDWKGRTSTISYFNSGGVKQRTLGGALGSEVVKATLGYHPDGAAASLAWVRRSDSATVRSHTAIGYDVGGLRTGETVAEIHPSSVSPTPDSGGDASFEYDLLDRLVSRTSPFTASGDSAAPLTRYALDDSGAITNERVTVAGTEQKEISSSYTAGRLDSQTIEDGGTTTLTFAYSDLGEETSRSAGSSSVTRTYDPAGHARLVDSPSGPDVSYVYDASDRLVSRTEGSEVTLYFTWGTGATLAEEAAPDGSTLRRYLTDAGGAQLAQQAGDPATGEWTWLLASIDGDTATHLKEDGTATQQIAFDPYGKIEGAGSSKDSAAPKVTLGYQGALQDSVTGSVILGPRLYDPATARFTTADYFVGASLDMALGIDPLTGNRFMFAGANPVGGFDNGHYRLDDDPNHRHQSGCRDQQCLSDNTEARCRGACPQNPNSSIGAIVELVAHVVSFGGTTECKNGNKVSCATLIPGLKLLDEAVEWGLRGLKWAGRKLRSILRTWLSSDRVRESLGRYIGILRTAARGKGNFGLGTVTSGEAELLGRAWVGPNYRVASDGRILISENGLRQFRPPTFKPDLRMTQANLESRYVPYGPWQANGHLDIVDP